MKIIFTFADPKKGAIAQLVEQRTENPCVAGSIPAGTTSKASTKVEAFLLIILTFEESVYGFHHYIVQYIARLDNYLNQ